MRTCIVDGEVCTLLDGDCMHPEAAFGPGARILAGNVRLLPDRSGCVRLAQEGSYTIAFAPTGASAHCRPVAAHLLLCIAVGLAALALNTIPPNIGSRGIFLLDNLLLDNNPSPHLDIATPTALPTPTHKPALTQKARPQPCAELVGLSSAAPTRDPFGYINALHACLRAHGLFSSSEAAAVELARIYVQTHEFRQTDLPWLRELSHELARTSQYIDLAAFLALKSARVSRNFKLAPLASSSYKDALAHLATLHALTSSNDSSNIVASMDLIPDAAALFADVLDEFVRFSSMEQPHETLALLREILTSISMSHLDRAATHTASDLSRTSDTLVSSSLTLVPSNLHFVLQSYIHLLCTLPLDQTSFDAALQLITEANAALPVNYRTLQNIGVFLLSNGDWHEANAVLLSALHLKLLGWHLISKPEDQRHDCRTFAIHDWSAEATLRASLSPPTLLDLQVLVLHESNSAPQQPPEPQHQQSPHTWRGSLPVCATPHCGGYSLAFSDSRLVLLKMRDAWLEAPPDSNGLLSIHAQCSFHITSKMQTTSLGAVEPRPGDTFLADNRPVVRLDYAIHLHWFTTNYYHFTCEVLPKLIWLMSLQHQHQGQVDGASDSESVAAASISLRPKSILLQKTQFTMEYLDLISFPMELVKWVSGDEERYNFAHLHVLEFSSDSDVRFSAAPAALLKAARRTLAPPLPLAQRKTIVYLQRRSDAVQRAVRGDALLLRELEVFTQLRNLTLVVLGDRDLPSVKSQVALLRSARVVIGAHGAGLANCIWAGPGTTIVEFPVSPLQPSTFSYLAQALDLDYWIVPEVSATQISHYTITPSAIPSILETLRQILLP